MQIFGRLYFRDRRLLRVALLLIHYGVRTQRIMEWTGLNRDRVKHLKREYAVDAQGRPPKRRNGPVLKAIGSLLHPRLRDEAAVAAAYCKLENVEPPSPGIPPVIGAERLCRAFRRYREAVSNPSLCFERVMALVKALKIGDDIALSHCTGPCNSHLAILVDPRSLKPHLCSRCVRAERAVKRKCKTRPAGPCKPINEE